MKKRIILIIISLSLFSCSDNYDDKIISYVEIKYGKNFEESEVDLNDVFDFEWDILYVCGTYGFDQEISNSIGFNTQYDYVKEGKTLFAFIKNDKVVEEKLISCNRISFFDDDESECLKIKSSDAKFKVKNLPEKGQNYWLYKQ